MRYKKLSYAVIGVCLYLLSVSHGHAAHDYYLPLFKPQPNYWSGLGITNLSSISEANITATIYSKTGVPLKTETKTISAGGQDNFTVGSSLTNNGWIKITSDQPLAGLNFLGQYKNGSLDYYLADVPFTNTGSKALLIPHVAQNPNWDTTVYIANTESSPGSIILTYKNKSGIATAPYTVTIHGNGTQEIPVSAIGKSTSIYGGSVSITSTRKITAFALYNNIKTGNYSYAGINAIDISSVPVSGYTYYLPVFKPRPGYWSGFGITNLNSTNNADITATVYGKSGAVLGTETKTIPSGGQNSFVVGNSLINDGWIKITSNQALAGLNFLGQYKSGTTDYYLADVPFTNTGSKSLLIPHVAQNPNWDTTVYIANTESSPGSITLTYKNKSGAATTPYTVSIHGNGTQEIPVSAIGKSTSIYGGSVTINSTRDIVAFALYNNIKTGNYSYAGINAVDISRNTGCVFSISPSSGSFTSSGGNSSVSVTASKPDCTWTTTNNLSWVTVSPASGTGSGSVTVSVSANIGVARIGSVTIAGQTYSISQTSGISFCIYSISPSSGSFTSSGGTSSVSVIASSSSCSWTTSESLDWVSLSPTSGTGSRSVTVTVTANSGAARSGSVTIAGQTYSISQATGISFCFYSISPSSGSFTSGSGSKSVSVTASSSSCAWTAYSAHSWVTVSPTSGTGSRSVTVSVSANTGVARSGSVTIAGKTYSISQERASGICGAYVTPNVWKQFDCYNLAAIGKTTNDDPFTPSWRLIGGYWQWGRKGLSSSPWYNTSNFAHGPTGPGVNEANSGPISGWDQTYAPDGSWSDTIKTANDPCPSGFRVPAKTQWDGVRANNTQGTVGTWSDSATNYSSGRFFGGDLMLPAAGFRLISGGALGNRGGYGAYWSSTQLFSDDAWGLGVYISYASTGSGIRSYGFSVRCVAE